MVGWWKCSPGNEWSQIVLTDLHPAIFYQTGCSGRQNWRFSGWRFFNYRLHFLEKRSIFGVGSGTIFDWKPIVFLMLTANGYAWCRQIFLPGFHKWLAIQHFFRNISSNQHLHNFGNNQRWYFRPPPCFPKREIKFLPFSAFPVFLKTWSFAFPGTGSGNL